MPARFKVYTRLEPQLDRALHTLGQEVSRESANRRRRAAGLARRPSELSYLRSRAEEQAARELEARKYPEPKLLEPPAPQPPAPYKSAEDELTEFLEKVPLVDTTHAEQLLLLPLPA